MLLDVADRRFVNILRSRAGPQLAYPSQIGAVQQFQRFALSFIKMARRWRTLKLLETDVSVLPPAQSLQDVPQ
jgi:hypothetical protein